MPAKTKTIVDVHPNVILVHQGDTSNPEMRLITHANCEDADGVLDVVLKGLKAQGRKMTVKKFDIAGNPIK